MNLYKYVSFDIWDKVLKEKQIRFTQPSVFNDPFEMQPFYEPLANDDEVQRAIGDAEFKAIFEEHFFKQYGNLPAEIQSIVSRELLMSFLTDMVFPTVVEHAPAVLDGLTAAISEGLYTGFDNNIGVLSLSEKRDDLLMWAHYAQNHRGFVIGFDGGHGYFHQRLSPSDEFRHVRKVQYSKSRPNIKLTTVEDATGIFLTKSEDWRYEDEWRMMRPLANASETKVVGDRSVHLFSFPPACVTEVILGYRMAPQFKKEIFEYLSSDEQYSHVEKYEALLDEREFKLNIVLAEI
jgi:Protein of unknown function (DUF2971)